MVPKGADSDHGDINQRDDSCPLLRIDEQNQQRNFLGTTSAKARASHKHRYQPDRWPAGAKISKN
jgi:hypothetical protein